jgi:uncharacterized damage-inducible protein DinB
MNESARLAQQVRLALFGEAWYGPSWSEILEGIPREAAVARPLPDVHTIAEIVLHTITWHDAIRRRILGETPEVSDAEDWPDRNPVDEASWNALVQQLLRTGRELVEAMTGFPPDRLQEPRPGLGPEETWYRLFCGQMQHILYHLGQVALLKKATRASG